MPHQTQAEQAAAPTAPDSGARIDNAFIVGERSPAPADTGQMGYRKSRRYRESNSSFGFWLRLPRRLREFRNGKACLKVGQKLMPIAMMISGVGLFLIGAAAFLRDCQSILSGDSCGSTTVEDFLAQLSLFYYNGSTFGIVNNLMSLPLSYVLFGMGTAAFIVGGLGSLRGR
jgi:hypothetical protein